MFLAFNNVIIKTFPITNAGFLLADPLQSHPLPHPPSDHRPLREKLPPYQEPKRHDQERSLGKLHTEKSF